MGLIGGSLAKAVKENLNARVYAYDHNILSLETTKSEGVIDGELNSSVLPLCDLVVLCLYPNDIIRYVDEHKNLFAPNCCIIDFGGIKRKIISECKAILSDTTVNFIGCHPMAGREVSGYQHSLESLFRGRSMIMVPDDAPAELVEQLQIFFKVIGVGKIIITTAENHDKVIAFTSQLAHVLSNAYVKSPRALQHKGYTGGSFQDLSRVAKLNAKMWTELFMVNRDFLIEEIEILITHLSEYSNALREENENELYRLLKEGSDIKERLNDEDCQN